MANGYTVEYRPGVVEDDLSGIPRNILGRIIKAIEQRLMVAPDRYGRRLRRSLVGLWKLRVGDYRIVYELSRQKTVRIWVIAHRRKAYEMALRRWGAGS